MWSVSPRLCGAGIFYLETTKGDRFGRLFLFPAPFPKLKDRTHDTHKTPTKI